MYTNIEKFLVLYRVTPYFDGNNKLTNGVNVEAYTIKNNGELHYST